VRAALRKSSPEMRRDSWSNARIRSARGVAIAMSIQLSKTTRFICGACAMNVYAIRGLLCHSLNLNSPAKTGHFVVSATSACRKHSQQEPSSLVSDALEFHMPRTCRRCACSRDSDTPNIFQRRGSTSCWLVVEVVVSGED